MFCVGFDEEWNYWFFEDRCKMFIFSIRTLCAVCLLETTYYFWYLDQNMLISGWSNLIFVQSWVIMTRFSQYLRTKDGLIWLFLWSFLWFWNITSFRRTFVTPHLPIYLSYLAPRIEYFTFRTIKFCWLTAWCASHLL